MPKKKKRVASKKKRGKKTSKKKSFEFYMNKYRWHLAAFAVILFIIFSIVFLITSFNQEDSQEKLVPTTDKDEPFVENYFIKEFDCTGKNTFRDDCFRNIQLYPEEEIYYLSPGERFVIFLAIKNKEETNDVFSYSLNSLPAVSLKREGCPLPRDADSFITGNTLNDFVIPSKEILVNELIIQAPSNIPEAGCGYIYVLEIKHAGSIYERDTIEILVK